MNSYQKVIAQNFSFFKINTEIIQLCYVISGKDLDKFIHRGSFPKIWFDVVFSQLIIKGTF